VSPCVSTRFDTDAEADSTYGDAMLRGEQW